MRARILALYEEDRGRSLEPSDLLSDLQAQCPKSSTAHVEYHLARLRELGLIPAERPEGI